MDATLANRLGEVQCPLQPPKDARLSPSASLLSWLWPPCPLAAHLVVVASTEEDVVGGGVPLDQSHAPAVPMQLQESLRHVPLQPTLGDLPDPHLQSGWRAKADGGRTRRSPCCPFLGHQICLVRHLLVRAVGRAWLRLGGGGRLQGVGREKRDHLLWAFGRIFSKKSLQILATINPGMFVILSV